MDTIKKVRGKYGMKFTEAVDYSVDKKKQLIYNVVEKVCGVDLDDEAGDNEEHSGVESGEESTNSDNIKDAAESDEYQTDEDSADEESEESHDNETAVDEGEIWQELKDDAAKFDVDILQIVASYIRLCLALKRDAVYKSVMETVYHAMVINEKDFDNALDFAIQTRKFLILQAYQKAKHVAC